MYVIKRINIIMKVIFVIEIVCSILHITVIVVTIMTISIVYQVLCVINNVSSFEWTTTTIANNKHNNNKNNNANNNDNNNNNNYNNANNHNNSDCLEGLLFTQADKNGRPYQVYYLNNVEANIMSQQTPVMSQFDFIYEELNQSCFVHITKTKSGVRQI